MTSTEAEQEIYFFSHVPKTGGLTVIRHLKRFLGNKILAFDKQAPDILTYGNDMGFDAALEIRSTPLLVAGHGVGRRTAQCFPHREARYITTLRDPAEMMLSQYNYRMQQTLNGVDSFDHHYTRDASGRLVLPAFKSFWGEYGVKNVMTYSILSHLGEEDQSFLTGNDAVECAFSILEDCWLVADCRNIAEDFVPLTTALEVPPIVSKENSSLPLHIMTEEIKAFCDDFWRLDRRLYDMVAAHKNRQN